ncbi:2-oxoacid:acceptor oxidoreductase family protein [Amycolatopsis sp. CA-230715]|uniref:2-oxoacid:acceptor oxidoreductase family protein n=1 Tax=Amycolatopsis sp. CA-230715 TaxID=2745196 RepID=UPI001C01B533|nr:2-oxoacid:acceptor oxidoreductase family protein [Amycolatopsis sp. CA-230715]QWF77966.1 Pyruvate synthase subunit PorC [Amycolatopsis sp. CA-230715]
MFEVRIHGRGGQGVVTAAQLLSMAAFAEGRHAQAFPSFGSERTGAPVVAFVRVGDSAIRTREPVVRPDAMIVQDATLLHQVALFEGFGSGGYLLVNAARTPEELGFGEVARGLRPDRLAMVPATELSLSRIGRPVPNAALLGGFAALTGLVRLRSVVSAIEERFAGELAEGNVAAATAAFDFVVAAREELTGAQAD